MQVLGGSNPFFYLSSAHENINIFIVQCHSFLYIVLQITLKCVNLRRVHSEHPGMLMWLSLVFNVCATVTVVISSAL